MKRPYLTSVSVGKRWWYIHTKHKYGLVWRKFLGKTIIVTSYKRSGEKF